MSDGAVTLLLHGDDGPPEWAEPLDARAVSFDSRPGAAAPRLEDAGCVLVDAASTDAMRAARAAHAADPDVQVVIVVEPRARRAVERAMLFTPGLGELWLEPPDAISRATIERAHGVTRQRRRYQRTRERMRADAVLSSPQRAERALLSDAYLASLLRVLPEAVFSVDAAGYVLSANTAAAPLLGREEEGVVGSLLSELMGVGGHVVREALTAARSGPDRRDVGFRLPDGEERYGELLVTHVSGSRPPIFAVVLRDISDRQEAQAQLERQASELEEQATELEAQTEALEHSNAELQRQASALEKALAARSRFYAAMSHELRTPINAVLGYNALLLDGILGMLEEQQREGLERSQRAARHLLELVNDVLDLARIEAGRMEMEPEEVEAGVLLRELLETVRPTADASSTPLHLEVPAEPLRIVTDPRRVRQIALNLLSNAVKFGGGRPVTVRCQPGDGGGVTIEVVDRGPGIAVGDQERIFEEFVRLDAESQVGTGLGLPISRRLSQLLGGSLQVASQPGKGATFRVHLPAAVRDARPAEG
ncbi:MAG TPA: ATP-binding protein [Gemmatimonadales bacterium]